MWGGWGVRQPSIWAFTNCFTQLKPIELIICYLNTGQQQLLRYVYSYRYSSYIAVAVADTDTHSKRYKYRYRYSYSCSAKCSQAQQTHQKNAALIERERER